MSTPELFPEMAPRTSLSYSSSSRFRCALARVRHGIGPGIQSKNGNMLTMLTVGAPNFASSSTTCQRRRCRKRELKAEMEVQLTSIPSFTSGESYSTPNAAAKMVLAGTLSGSMKKVSHAPRRLNIPLDVSKPVFPTIAQKKLDASQ